jgi:hypothetical protein
MLQISEYFSEGGSSNNDVSKVNSAMSELESNILTLRQGGKISDIDLKPLPSQFLDDWNTIYQKWVSLKTTLTNNNIIKPNEMINSAATTVPIDKVIKATIETTASSLVDSSNVLVTKLGEYARSSSQNSMFLQGIFDLTLLNGVLSEKVLRTIGGGTTTGIERK